MRKSKAINLLKQQIDKLNDENYFKDENWCNQTRTYLKDIFGEKSEEYLRLKNFRFVYYEKDKEIPEWSKNELDSNIENAINFLLSCIETIKTIGITTENKNIFSKYKTLEIIGFLITLGLIIYGIGNYFGYEKADKQNIELRQENKLLKDSLTTLRTTFKVPNNITNDNPRNKK